MMNSRMGFTIVAVLVAAFLALLAAPAVLASVGDPVYAVAHTGQASAAPQRLAVPDTAVAALPVTSSRVFRTYTVTGLHIEPEKSSTVISWIMPNAPVRILGLSRDLAFFAMASNENSPIVAGWIAMKDVAFEPPTKLALRVAMAYGQPDTNSESIDYVVPDQPISLLGVSPDGKWSAVRIGGITGTAAWVQSVHLRQTIK